MPWEREALATGARALVCGHERHIVRLIESNLARQGYAVTCAYGGREAISLLERDEFDLAVIDRDMPDVSGQEVLAWIRANERTKDLRVVVLDNDRHDDDPSDPSGPTAGANLWLTKPFDLGKLLNLGRNG